MFKLLNNVSLVALQRQHVLSLYESSNAISVRVAGLPTEPAAAYIVAWEERVGLGSVVCALHFRDAARIAAYCDEPKIFPIGDLPERLAQAIQFAESMGYMVEDSGFDSLPVAEQDALMATSPVFHPDLKRLASSGANASGRSSLAPGMAAGTNDPDGVDVDLDEVVELSTSDIVESARGAQRSGTKPALGPEVVQVFLAF